MDLEAPSEVMASRLGLMSAAETRPVQHVLDDVHCLATDMEQARDLGEGKRDHARTPRGHRLTIRYC